MHICMKVIYVRSPQITGQDTTSFIGYFIVPCIFIMGKLNSANLNIFTYETKVQKIMLARCITGVALDIFITNGLRFIAVSKGILIFCLNPLFCAIIAAIFLHEKITMISISSTIGAFFGIYLLTLNRGQDSESSGHEILGYILVLGSAICYGLLFVWLRALSLFKINIFLSPFCFGMAINIQTLTLLLFFPDMMHISTYDSVDLFYLCIIGVTAVTGQQTMFLANRYAMASKMAPISYLENVFTLMADIWLFHYHFVSTDIFGMLVIVVCLAVPVTLQMSGKQI